MSEPGGEVILYRSDDGQALVQLHSVGGTVWLTQAQLAELYDTSVPNIVQIIRRVLADGEVDPATTNSELRVQLEGPTSRPWVWVSHHRIALGKPHLSKGGLP